MRDVRRPQSGPRIDPLTRLSGYRMLSSCQGVLAGDAEQRIGSTALLGRAGGLC